MIAKNEHKELAENIFEGTNVIIRTDGAKHLGAIIGTSDYKETFIKNLVNQWVNELRELTKIAKSEPQAAYSNFTHSLRQKWNFAMRTIPGLENYLQPLEDVISKDFLPDLLGCPIKQEIRELISLPPRLGGMGIINPIKAAVEEFKNSVRLTEQLTKKIVEQDKDGSINKDSVKEARRGIAKQREKDQQGELQKILGGEQLGLYEKKENRNVS